LILDTTSLVAHSVFNIILWVCHTYTKSTFIGTIDSYTFQSNRSNTARNLYPTWHEQS